jgi:hypothetical protein
VRAGFVGIAGFSLNIVLLAAAPGHAQSPPPPAASTAPLPAPGFMPPYEVTKTVRSAGFEPLAPPLREGTTYVLRATDFRGILMRVVVDAHSGAIRAVNRIVPGPGYGPIGMMTPPYGEPPAYGELPSAEGPEMMPDEAALAPPPPLPAPPPSILRLPPHPSVSGPPLPRPRPAELASRDAKPAVKPVDGPPLVRPVEAPAIKPPVDAKPSATITPASPPPAPVVPKKPPPAAIPD